ncbi:MAG: hypothetical protein ACYDH3_11835, partial [Candidatus Aminicenantales bacterium]
MEWPVKGALFLLLSGAALFVRLPYLIYWDLFYNSDTAVLGLMARHFLRGDFSLYYWGEAYYGALDPFLLAPLFKAFGATPAVSQWLPFVISLAVLWLYYRYLRLVLDFRSAYLATLAFALVPPAFFQITLWVYNYSFLLLFGIIHLIFFARFRQGERRKEFLFLWGLAAGFSWYYFRLIAVFWAALILTAVVARIGPEEWRKARAKIAVVRFPDFWKDVVLLRRTPLPRGLKFVLVAANFYNIANSIMACFLWIRGNWFWTLGRIRVKLYLWPIFKASLVLAFVVGAVVFHRKLFSLLRRCWSDVRIRVFVLGLFVGYAPAIYGYVTELFPSSPGGLVALPMIVKNLMMAIPTMTTWMAGTSRVPVLQGLAIAVVVAAFAFMMGLFWIQTRARFRRGTAVKPFYPVLALGLATAGLGIVGAVLADANTLRFFVPLFFCLPVGLALGLREIEKKSRILGWGLFLVFLANVLLANMIIWRNHQSPSRYERIADKLTAEKIRGGYADYWTSYSLTFLAGEKIIVTPLSGKERRPPYASF